MKLIQLEEGKLGVQEGKLAEGDFESALILLSFCPSASLATALQCLRSLNDRVGSFLNLKRPRKKFLNVSRTLNKS
jgi:hypothetical protein